MPGQGQKIGVPNIFLSVDDDTATPSLATTVFSACAMTPDDELLNDVNNPLLSTDTYEVIVGLVGRETVGTGYTVGRCSLSSGSLTLTSGQMIKVTVENAAWPAGFDTAICAVVFLKTNASNYQLCQFAYIDPSSDFTTVIKAKPLRVAPSFTYALLTSTTSDTILGSRSGLGVTYEEITPTTGTFNFRRPVSTVTVSPNTGADFQIATTRSSGIEFQSLVNDVKAWVQAAAGNYVSYQHNSATRKEAHMSLNTAQSLLRGNRPIKVVMPVDPADDTQETRLLIGCLTVNNIELTEAWSKTATTPVSFRFDAAPLDKLITNQHVELSYSE